MLLLMASHPPPFPGVQANTGCPESTDLLGILNLLSGCTITTLTTWGNGTVTIPGDLTLEAPLILYDVHIIFDMTSNQEYGLNVWSDFTMHGGSIASSNPAYHWKGTSLQGTTMYIDGALLRNAQNLRFDAAEQTVINSHINESTNPSPSTSVFWLGPNSTFMNNSVNDVMVSDQAAVALWRNYGNTEIIGNRLSLACNGNNCMGIIVNDIHSDHMPIYPGFPVVEVAWNTIVFQDIVAGSNVHPTDHEYSMRIYEHNNTVTNNDPQGDPLTEGLQMGGPLDSVFEHNTYYGPMTWGFYHYVYGAANNVIQYNSFNNTKWTGIVHTGGNTYRHNTFDNTEQGLWICPDSGCAGFDTNPANNAYYNNTHTYRAGTNHIAKIDTMGTDASALQNIHIAYGNANLDTYLDDGTVRTTLGIGPFLYWGNAQIDRLTFRTHSDGAREVVMTVSGVDYNSVDPDDEATGDLALTIAGPMDQTGSMNLGGDGRGTFLWALSQEETSFDVLSLGGDTTFEVDGFLPDTTYNVTLRDHDASTSEEQTFITDGNGAGSSSKSLSAHHYTITMAAASSDGDESVTLTFQQGDGGAHSETDDAYIYSGEPDTNYGSVTELLVDADNCSANETVCRALIKFPDFIGPEASQVPAGATILSATLEMTVTDPGGTQLAYQVTEGWTESDVTWNAFAVPGSPATVGDPVSYASPTGAVTLDVTSLVQNWVNGDANQGLFITTSSADGTDYLSSESTSPPKLTVTFQSPTESPDDTPPARVTDLTVAATSSNFAVLEWTAPGDNGTEGQASAYEIRYSTAGPLNDTTFSTGTAVSAPAPGPAGTLEEFNVTGLSPATGYWFALRTADEVPNWSPVSNSPSGTTGGGGNDTQPPSVRFVSPTGGQVVYGDVEVSLEASDNVGVAEVSLWVDDVQVTSFTAAPYQWTWSTSGLAAGTYRLLARATDETGNQASDSISLHVWAPGDSESPTVESVQYSPSESTVEVQFSKPMNATSVADALSFRPQLAYTLHWVGPAHLVIVLLESPASEMMYELTIAILARDLDGRPLATPVTVGLVVPATQAATPFYLNPWIWAVGLLAVWWLVTLAKYRRSQARLARLEAAARMEARSSSEPRLRDPEPSGFGPR